MSENLKRFEYFVYQERLNPQGITIVLLRDGSSRDHLRDWRISREFLGKAQFSFINNKAIVKLFSFLPADKQVSGQYFPSPETVALNKPRITAVGESWEVIHSEIRDYDSRDFCITPVKNSRLKIEIQDIGGDIITSKDMEINVAPKFNKSCSADAITTRRFSEPSESLDKAVPPPQAEVPEDDADVGLLDEQPGAEGERGADRRNRQVTSARNICHNFKISQGSHSTVLIGNGGVQTAAPRQTVQLDAAIGQRSEEEVRNIPVVEQPENERNAEIPEVVPQQAEQDRQEGNAEECEGSIQPTEVDLNEARSAPVSSVGHNRRENRYKPYQRPRENQT